MANKDRWVRRFSIDETAKHSSGFTIYKITSVLFPIHSPEVVTVVSVWKRYSDLQQLHKVMKSLHAGLHLRGTFPELVKGNYFKRFDQEVITERAKTIKKVLDFVAEHRLLFTSTDFVNFLQSGYPEPSTTATQVVSTEPQPTGGVLSHDNLDESRSQDTIDNIPVKPKIIDNELPRIPIYEAFDVEIREESIKKSISDSSLASIESLTLDFYDDVNKITINTDRSIKKKTVLPDLINFDLPSTSRVNEEIKISDSLSMDLNLDSNKSREALKNVDLTTHNIKTEDILINNKIDCLNNQQDTIIPEVIKKTQDTPKIDYQTSEIDSITSETDFHRSDSIISLSSKRSLLSLSEFDSKLKLDNSYIFEAGHLLNLAARSEEGRHYQKAFDLYKEGIELLLIGVKDDPDPKRKLLIKEKINKYLCYAETIYRNHLCELETNVLLPPVPVNPYSIPNSADLSTFRVLSVLSERVMLVLNECTNKCYALKVIQKIPNNLTEFDDTYLKTVNDTKIPIFPTNVCYMVTLHYFIETNNLFFLFLSYAPGEKLFDYIKNYAISIQNTPKRTSNLENVFIEPKLINKNDITTVNDINTNDIVNESDIKNQSIENDIDMIDNNDINVEDVNTTQCRESLDLGVNDIVLNSQRLLQNVDKVLKDLKSFDFENRNDMIMNETDTNINLNNDMNNDDINDNENDKDKLEVQSGMTGSPIKYKCIITKRDILPPATICKWGAEILTAIDCLHNCGVVCRDLNPSNILLSANGQVTVTYFVGYSDYAVTLSRLQRRVKPGYVDLYCAPELYEVTFDEIDNMAVDVLCDFWSFGAIMYELICGVPLSQYHNSVFTSHTILQTPDGLDYEALSLLTQLLTHSPQQRLGSKGINEIKLHPYFKQIDWTKIYHDWTPLD